MSSDSLENEDLDNVPLVRMEDVQPSRDRGVDPRVSSKDDVEVYETCIIDDIEYENECIVNDDEDSNIGSMVSLQSEDVYEDDSSSQELIIPEVLDEVETENDEDEGEIDLATQPEDSPTVIEAHEEGEEPSHEFIVTPIASEDVEEQLDAEIQAARQKNMNIRHIQSASAKHSLQTTTIEIEVPANKVKRVEELVLTPPSESWPTLEILPGGVIKNTDKYESDSFLYPDKIQDTASNVGEMMYACAKCSQTFKYLFCLVKHVKWHEDQKKIIKNPHEGKLKGSTNKYICLHSGKKKIVAAERNKRKTAKRLKS